MSKKASTKIATVNVNDFETFDAESRLAEIFANPSAIVDTNAADTNAADTNAADTNAADTNAADTNANAAAVENPAIVDATQIDFKAAKLRGLPKGITIENAKIILRAITAIKRGETHNVKKSFIKGYNVKAYQAFMDNQYLDVCGVDCLVINYTGKNRTIVLATVLNDITISIRITTSTQKYPIRDLVAQGYQDNYGYIDLVIKAIRNAIDEKRVLVGTLSFNRVAEDNIGLDCIFNRKCDINWLKKHNPELLTCAESIDIDDFKPDIAIDYKDIDKVLGYVRYLNQIIKNAEGNATPNQIAAASKVKAALIG